MVNLSPQDKGLVKDNQAGDSEKNQDDITHPLNDPVSKTDTKHGGQGLQGNNDPVVKQLVSTSGDAETQVTITHPFNEYVRQATLGRLICEQCGIDTERKTHNQRFCCTDCRVKNWEKSTGGKVLKKKAPAGGD